MRAFLSSVRARLSLLSGASGDPMDRAVTFNDLVAMGVVDADSAETQARSAR